MRAYFIRHVPDVNWRRGMPCTLADVEVTRALPAPKESEADWLDRYDPDDFAADHPSVAVDVVLLAVREASLRVPLVRRMEHPAYGSWVLPGGFVRRDERVDAAARRVLREKVGIRQRIGLERFHFFDLPGRDSRTRVLSMGYLAPVRAELLPTQDGLSRLEGVVDGHKLRDTLGNVVTLGFDHDEIVAAAVDHARQAARDDLLWPVRMLSEDVFTVPDLSEARQALGLFMSVDALRRRVAADPRVTRADETVSRGTGRRPPEGYRLLR
jgi:8-oxo-dGTP diphosphatase